MGTSHVLGNRLDSGKTESIAETASRYEKAEFVAKLGTASLPLTYVSGYLIATSYLGTYGLHPDASDFFRSKYIYVGFLYLIFLALMASIAWLVIQVVGAIFTVGSTTAPRDRKELVRARRELNYRKQKNSSRTLIRGFRWHLVVTFILIVFSFEIMFLNPEGINWYLPSQVIFLLGVVLYQCSSYAELRDPYTWGLVHGRTYVESSRWTLFFSQATMVALMFVMAWRSIKMDLHPLILIHMNISKLIRALSIAAQILAACSLFSRTERLKAIDAKGILPSPEENNDTLIWKHIVRELWRAMQSPWGCLCGYFFVEERVKKRTLERIGRAAFLFLLIALDFWLIYRGEAYSSLHHSVRREKALIHSGC
jgi:hypothetical protein